MEVPAGIALGIAGFAAAAATWLPWFKGHVSTRVFTDVLLRLLAAGEFDKAGRLVRVAPASPFVAGARAALEAPVISGEPESETLARLRGAFDPPIHAAIARLSARWWLPAGAIAAAAAGALVLERAGGPWFVPLAAALPLASTWRLARALARGAAAERDRLLAGIAAARRAAA